MDFDLSFVCFHFVLKRPIFQTELAYKLSFRKLWTMMFTLVGLLKRIRSSRKTNRRHIKRSVSINFMSCLIVLPYLICTSSLKLMLPTCMYRKAKESETLKTTTIQDHHRYENYISMYGISVQCTRQVPVIYLFIHCR